MAELKSESRRRLLQRVVLLAPLGAIAAARAGEASRPLLDATSAAARTLKYVDNAKDAAGATAGSSCANCALYQGASGSTQGPCQLFPGQDVRASGWCASWSPQM